MPLKGVCEFEGYARIYAIRIRVVLVVLLVRAFAARITPSTFLENRNQWRRNPAATTAGPSSTTSGTTTEGRAIIHTTIRCAGTTLMSGTRWIITNGDSAASSCRVNEQRAGLVLHHVSVLLEEIVQRVHLCLVLALAQLVHVLAGALLVGGVHINGNERALQHVRVPVAERHGARVATTTRTMNCKARQVWDFIFFVRRTLVVTMLL